MASRKVLYPVIVSPVADLETQDAKTSQKEKARPLAELPPPSLLPGEHADEIPRVPSPQPEMGNLVQKILLVEKEIEELFAYAKNFRASLEIKLETASLLSREQVADMLYSSLSQVYRWTKSGELRATWLDQHPRYRPKDIEAFIDSRVKSGKPTKKAQSPSCHTSGSRSKQVLEKTINMKKRLS